MTANPQNTETAVPIRETTQQLIELFHRVWERAGMNEPPNTENPDKLNGAEERLRPWIDRFHSEVFSLVVIGEIKKGKSSLINALLGLDDVLPVSDSVSTSTVFKLVFGEVPRFHVVLRKNPEQSNDQEPKEEIIQTAEDISASIDQTIESGYILEEIEISQDEIPAYGTEDGNPLNEKGVDHIRLEIPSPILKQGLEIIDTPGLGGLIREHGEITWQYIPQAHAVIFVLESAQSPFTREESKYLQKIKSMASIICFAQTKIDAVDVSTWQSWQQRNLTEIAKTLDVSERDILYFPVSSELKKRSHRNGRKRDLERSGFLPLEEFLFQKLKGTLEMQVCHGVIQAIHKEVQSKLQEAKQSLEIFQVDSNKSLDQLERVYTRKLKEVNRFGEQDFTKLMNYFQEKFRTLVKAGSEELKDFLSPGSFNPLAVKFIEDIQGLKKKPKELKPKINEFCNQFTESCASQAQEIYTCHRARILEHISKGFITITNRLIQLKLIEPDEPKIQTSQKTRKNELVQATIEPKVVPGLHFPQADRNQITNWDKAKLYAIGAGVGTSFGMATGFVGSVCASVLFFPVNPYFLIICTGTLGKVLGSYFTKVDISRKQTRQILAHIEKVFSATLSQLNKHFLRAYAEEMGTLERNILEEKNRVIRTVKKNIAEHCKEIKHRRQSAKKEVDLQLHHLSMCLRHLNSLDTACIQAAKQVQVH